MCAALFAGDQVYYRVRFHYVDRLLRRIALSRKYQRAAWGLGQESSFGLIANSRYEYFSHCHRTIRMDIEMFPFVSTRRDAHNLGNLNARATRDVGDVIRSRSPELAGFDMAVQWCVPVLCNPNHVCWSSNPCWLVWIPMSVGTCFVLNAQKTCAYTGEFPEIGSNLSGLKMLIISK